VRGGQRKHRRRRKAAQTEIKAASRQRWRTAAVSAVKAFCGGTAGSRKRTWKDREEGRTLQAARSAAKSEEARCILDTRKEKLGSRAGQKGQRKLGFKTRLPGWKNGVKEKLTPKRTKGGGKKRKDSALVASNACGGALPLGTSCGTQKNRVWRRHHACMLDIG